MSDTPRTKAAIRIFGDYIRSEPAVPVDFAEELERELAEARAEIERLKAEIRDNNYLAARQIVPAEMAVDDLCAELERKDALIEQMREALQNALEALELEQCDEYGKPVWHQDEIKQIKAALRAADGGE